VNKSKLTRVGEIKRPLATKIIWEDLNRIFTKEKIKGTSESFTLNDSMILVY
jgi:hypothetical protein